MGKEGGGGRGGVVRGVGGIMSGVAVGTGVIVTAVEVGEGGEGGKERMEGLFGMGG